MTLAMWFGLGIFLAVVFFIFMMIDYTSAKRKAKRILTAKKIGNMKEFNRICATLSAHGKDDLETADLWKKLQELKEAYPNQS